MEWPVFLGIETSCDETGCGIVSGEGEVLAGVVASQVAEHERFGGVVPEIASRAHAEAIVGVIDRSLAKAGMEPGDIGVVAVTAGPGLIGPLLTGIAAAEGFAGALGIPLIPVNHLHAHVYGTGVAGGVEPPYTGLVISGGHTAFYRWEEGQEAPQLLGTTVDDAAGEAFDKVAKILGLGYPGGPAVEKAAAHGDAWAVKFPRPGVKMEGLRMSFSGLKTAVLYHVREMGREPDAVEKADIAASFQRAVAEALALKSARALEETGHRTFVAGGGVAANGAVREALAGACRETGVRIVLPEAGMAGDNGVMVAQMGRFMYNKGLWISPAGAGIKPYAGGEERMQRGRRR
ncbi:MAG: tRNA (adenosine(37)-N6)-threonylcarbamoyltransferase complex transferase subunit TsaD [Planctomycetes bacterium]|nr:tRNA (adenosine(37)-N6)-threonylcarbamoyltransferase complex transferase subunit TsaD [Planctomycetota bacterium]